MAFKDRRYPAIACVATCLAILHQAEAFCPHLCHCDDLQMVVTCPPESKLDVIPITLNPMIKQLHLKGKQQNIFSLYTKIVQFK